MPKTAKDFDVWDRRVQDLLALYRNLELRALALPVFSVAPLLVYFWNGAKLILFMELDLIFLIPVLIPMWLVVFVRNRFSGQKWRYRSFSKRYFAYVIGWIWRGEAPSPAGIVIRKLVVLSLHVHSRTRLQLLRTRINIDGGLTEKDRRELLSRVDGALERLGGRGIPTWYGYVLPLAAFVVSLFNAFHSGPSSGVAEGAAFILIASSFSFVLSTFIVKRGLMLGASGNSS